MIKDPEDQNEKNRMSKLKDDRISSGCHLGGTDKGDAHGGRADTSEDDG